MMATCSRCEDESGKESTCMSPSAVAGSCITRRADARTPIAPNSRTADRSTSSEVAAFGTHARDV